MINRNYILILCLIVQYSCISTKQLKEIKPININPFSIEIFNGNYQNKEDSTNWSLWEILFDCYSFKKSFKNLTSENAVINLKYDNNEKLIVTAIDNGNIVDAIELKCKIEGEYLSIKKKILLIPIPFFFIHSELRVLLGNKDTEKLIAKRGSISGSWILVMAGGGNLIEMSLQFSKID